MEPNNILSAVSIVILFCCTVVSFEVKNDTDTNPSNVFNGVYTECFFHLSYSCLQKKTLLYLKELNNLTEVSVIGDYVKFVKINTTRQYEDEEVNLGSTDELAFLIDKAVDDFFDNHILKFNAMGRDISLPRNMDEFVGRKKRKGGGGGGGGHSGGHDDGGKKKMMMMAMMCMKMKLMMMVPAMMGMMGMMSFKGMMFSMMSFMISKMMLLMKILEKKGGAGGLGSGGGDGGWAASGGGGGAWMPAGGQDFGGGGGGYDANGQWQSRSIIEGNFNKIYGKQTIDDKEFHRKEDTNTDKVNYSIDDVWKPPEISFVKPVVRFNNRIETDTHKNPVLVYKKSNVDFSNYGNEPQTIDDKDENLTKTDYNKRSKRSVDSDPVIDIIHNRANNKEREVKSRSRRSILDMIQNSYIYWINTLLGTNNNRRTNFQRYKIVNGVRYVYYPMKVQKPKMPKEVQLTSSVKVANDFKPIITAEDFNKGEIMEGAVESRMNKKKFHKMKETVNDTVEENPWE